ncbi:DegT/DnrJ/EryC1/StrS family aminotransferase [Actinosynnema sp. NPDC002837]
MINVFQPSLGDEEAEAVREVFATNWLGYGPRTRAFEAEFAAHLGVSSDQLIFINSATSGLFLATELLGLGPADDVVVPAISFVANGNAILSSGARPVFCDVDPHTLNPSVEDVERALTPRTKAVMVLHYGGFPGDIAAIAQLCQERGVVLIEDTVGSISSHVDGKMCGTFGDIAIWSFDSRKIISTGDGGMIFVRDPELHARAHRLAYHGLVDRSAFTTASKSPSHWWGLDIQDVGRRLIGNDVTAAIGSVQLRKLPGFIERRRQVSARYDELLAGVEGIRIPPPAPAGHGSSYCFYWVQIDPAIRDQVAADLLEQGIYTSFRYEPLHKVPIYGGSGELPGTDVASASTLLLPLHQAITDDEAETVATALVNSVAKRSNWTRVA